MESRANVFYGILLPRLQELMTNKHIGILNSWFGGVGEAKVLALFQRMLSVVLLGQSADMILQNRAMLKSILVCLSFMRVHCLFSSILRSFVKLAPEKRENHHRAEFRL